MINELEQMAQRSKAELDMIGQRIEVELARIAEDHRHRLEREERYLEIRKQLDLTDYLLTLFLHESW